MDLIHQGGLKRQVSSRLKKKALVLVNILVGSNSTREDIGPGLESEGRNCYEEIENTLQCDLIIKYNKKVIRRVDNEDQLNNDVEERTVMIRGDDSDCEDKDMCEQEL